MSIAGGLDIHRKQITFDYAGTATGEVRRGQIAPADREHLAAWLAGRFPGQDADFTVEGCTGWRYVAEELAAAGVTPHAGEPADTAALRGRKRHAKTDKTGSRHLRQLLGDGRLPECWVPPSRVLECRALLELYHDLRVGHTAWVQRIRAVLFHHGARQLGEQRLRTGEGVAALRAIAGRAAVAGRAASGRHGAGHAIGPGGAPGGAAPPAAGCDPAAGRREGASRAAVRRGPVTALALCCWLGGAGRFSSARKAVRFAGLDVTVCSSDGKRSPGHLSRQGPEVLRWCVYEAGKAHARGSAPDYRYYASVKDRIDGRRAAISEARKIIRQAVHILAELGDGALAPA